MKFIKLCIIAAITLLTIGCSQTPTQQLTLAENTYNSAEETLTLLHKQRVIPPQDDKAIILAVHTARSALDAAYTHVNDGAFNEAFASVTAAITTVVKLTAQAQVVGTTKPSP